MKKAWIAALCLALLLVLAGGAVFFTTIGSAYTADWLRGVGDGLSPAWAQRFYRWSLKSNPYDAETRLRLAARYEEENRVEEAEQLLREGIEDYNTGADLYVALSAFYVRNGSLDRACDLLDSAPAGYVTMRLSGLRPKNAAAPSSGVYRGAVTFSPQTERGTCWYRLNGERWTMYTAPVRMALGEHRLEVLTVSEAGVPSRPVAYDYTVEEAVAAFAPKQVITCPYCGEPVVLGAQPQE